MKLTKLGICGIISLLSYTAMVVFSPLVYPGYDWLSMAVCVASQNLKTKVLRLGIYFFAAMQWIIKQTIMIFLRETEVCGQKIFALHTLQERMQFQA